MFGYLRPVALLLGLLAVAASAGGPPDLNQAREQVVTTTNEFREQEGLPALKPNAELSKAAQSFAEFMAETGKYGHEADGKKPAERMKEAGYDYCMTAENLAYVENPAGFTAEGLAKKLVDGWKESPPHRKNLLDPDLQDIGVGLARSESGRYYAVQNFGRPKSAEIAFKLTNQTDAAVRYTLDGQEFSVEPRSTMTHQLCRPADLKLQAEGEEDQVLRPADGSHYVLRKEEAGKVRVEKK